MGQAFQASEKHPVGWEGKRLAVGWKLQDLPHGSSISGWQWMGAMVEQGQPGQGSWQRQIKLTASQDKDLVPLLRQVESIQTKHLTLVVTKSGKHLHKTPLLKENRKTNSLLFLFKIYFVHVFHGQETCLRKVGANLLFLPLSSWESLSQDEQPLWDLVRLG